MSTDKPLGQMTREEFEEHRRKYGSDVMNPAHREIMTTIQEIADMIDPRAAQMAIAMAMTAMGVESEWDSETIEIVAAPMVAIGKKLNLPTFTDTDESAVAFWRRASGEYDETEIGTMCGECEGFTYTDADGLCDECGEPKT